MMSFLGSSLLSSREDRSLFVESFTQCLSHRRILRSFVTPERSLVAVSGRDEGAIG